MNETSTNSVSVYGGANGWYVIEYNGVVGYSNADYIILQ